MTGRTTASHRRTGRRVSSAEEGRSGMVAARRREDCCLAVGQGNPHRKTPRSLPSLPLVSTSEVFIPGRGRGFQKFSFDFPEPSVEFSGLRFGFLAFTRENVYGLDGTRMEAESAGDTLTLSATGLVWAGGQERAAGRLTARFRKDGDTIEWD